MERAQRREIDALLALAYGLASKQPHAGRTLEVKRGYWLGEPEGRSRRSMYMLPGCVRIELYCWGGTVNPTVGYVAVSRDGKRPRVATAVTWPASQRERGLYTLQRPNDFLKVAMFEQGVKEPRDMDGSTVAFIKLLRKLCDDLSAS